MSDKDDSFEVGGEVWVYDLSRPIPPVGSENSGVCGLCGAVATRAIERIVGTVETEIDIVTVPVCESCYLESEIPF